MQSTTRRDFLRQAGLQAATLPFLLNLPSLGFANQSARKQRLVVMFSPNGVVPKQFWPTAVGKNFELPTSLKPLQPWKDRTLVLKGVCDRVGGDGDNHMRGIGCLLTGIELFPGNIQGGSATPAGWSSGKSIDQELKAFLQQSPGTRTRFGSLEFGVQVPERADTWTRMVYAGPNQPIAPIDQPQRMFQKLYGSMKDRVLVGSVLDQVLGDLKRLTAMVSAEDRQLLDQHATFVREMEQELRDEATQPVAHLVPEVDPAIRNDNDQFPKLSQLQVDLLVSSFVNDFTRIATLQYTNSVGNARMTWLGINESHHELSHEPDSNEAAQDKLTRINTFFCEQLAYLTKKLAETPEPGGGGSLLDNTTIIWTNELGQGNSHTLDDIPFVLVGNGLNFAMGQSLQLPGVSHNRLLMSIAHAFGHWVPTFGNPDYCGDGPLNLA